MTNEAIAIRTADSEDEVVDALTRAFVADPIARWAYPDEQQYARLFPQFARIFAQKAVEHRTAYRTDDLLGVAVWLPPGIHPDEEALSALFEESVASGEAEELGAFMEEMSRRHPDEPHWYLPLIGVAPSHCCQGIGSALLGFALRACDRDDAPAYLEATSTKSMTLYERHGFYRVGTIQAGRSPTMYPMLREARAVG